MVSLDSEVLQFLVAAVVCDVFTFSREFVYNLLMLMFSLFRPGGEEGKRDQRTKLVPKLLENSVMLRFFSYKGSFTSLYQLRMQY
ncbi:hypothetical protein C2S52_000279 [Perilla frutescens var. hirtella]|nr:hypothetical protein C2S52_000279 [Perilla frutescens var. hirtella]